MFDLEGERFTLVAVVAMARNRVIGREGAMPWKLGADLKRYRALTMGRPMIMGRKTLVSIGRVLDGRDTIVLTRSGDAPFEGAHAARDPDEALAIAARCARGRGTSEIVVAGGAEIYRLLLDRTDRIELTQIPAEPEGDTWFPEIDGRDFIAGERTAMERGPADTADADFVTLTRRSSR